MVVKFPLLAVCSASTVVYSVSVTLWGCMEDMKTYLTCHKGINEGHDPTLQPLVVMCWMCAEEAQELNHSTGAGTVGRDIFPCKIIHQR